MVIPLKLIRYLVIGKNKFGNQKRIFKIPQTKKLKDLNKSFNLTKKEETFQ